MALELLVVVLTVVASVVAQNLVCYYDSSAASYATPTLPQALSSTECTHYIYVGLGVTAQGDLRILSNYDVSSGFNDFQNLRAIGNVKLYIQLGTDLRDGTKNLTNAISGKCDKLVNNIALFLAQYNFDGVELERQTNDTDKNALAKCINKLRARLYMINKELAVAISAQWSNTYDITSLSLYTDMINVHGYNFTGTTTNTANLSPLFSDATSPTSVNSTLTALISAGARKSKINLVVATYARTYLLASEDQRGVGARTTGPGAAGANTNRAGLLARYEACPRFADYTEVDNSNTATTYYFKAKNWLSIEIENTLVQKFTFVLDNELGGAGIYTLDLDDVSNACGAGAFPAVQLANLYLF
ncbi:probable chitinase 10 [Anopheles cruzii]|uniref:probable chitinase 10 n=1 Tax=Anopheles cruzii TaxID=68878 RepID=UPI0022EC5BA1|nr:probable chitinase 10 [Anopheles cruzii]